MYAASYLLVAFICISSCCGIKNPCKNDDDTVSKKHHFEHPNYENKFIQCSDWGQMFIFSCPGTLVWVDKTASCDSVTARMKAISEQTKTTLSNARILLPMNKKSRESLTMTSISPINNKTKNSCSQVEISNSQLPIINGFYAESALSDKTTMPLYKRSDNFKLPGIIGNLPTFFKVFSR
jgi:hypothetical protein